MVDLNGLTLIINLFERLNMAKLFICVNALRIFGLNVMSQEINQAISELKTALSHVKRAERLVSKRLPYTAKYHAVRKLTTQIQDVIAELKE
jgi:hypothetical protein